MPRASTTGATTTRRGRAWKMRSASSRAPRAWSSPPGWPHSAPWSSRGCTAATCSWRRRMPIPASARSPATCSSPTASRCGSCPRPTMPCARRSRGATLVWLESPSNPGLDVLDLPALAAEAHAAGAVVAVDNTLAGPLRQRPLELGADYSVMSASKHLAGHSDLIMGTWRSPIRSARRRCARGGSPRARSRGRSRRGSRIARWPRWPCASSARRPTPARSPSGCAPVTTSATCAGPASARSSASTWARTPAPTRSWAPAPWWRRPTSFGGLHSNAERRARWGSDAVADGFIRLNAGIEDAPDLLADLERALELSRP